VTKDELGQLAVARYGQQRAQELEKRLQKIARWIALIQQQPLDLLDEVPDDGR